jgi:DNA uptake protein ComE-like DNA-binding protein
MVDFTQEERKVILFLVMVALLGMGVNFAVKQFGAGKSVGTFSEDLGKVDLNRADTKLLMGVSGIGEKLAGRIIEYRIKHEGFVDLGELKDIKGVSDSKFAKIKEYLAVK